jgi:hypothetical protein
MPLTDPFVQGICRAWEGVAQLANTIEAIKRRLPQHYRPLAKQTKSSELAERELPWVEKHRRAAAEVQRNRSTPHTPKSS